MIFQISINKNKIKSLIFFNSSSNLDVIEGSTLKLECAIILDTGVDDSQPFAIHWYWQNIPITNNSKGCGEDCQIQNESTQYFLITERIQTNRLYEQKVNNR
jgi:hypothetical protein